MSYLSDIIEIKRGYIKIITIATKVALLSGKINLKYTGMIIEKYNAHILYF